MIKIIILIIILKKIEREIIAGKIEGEREREKW